MDEPPFQIWTSLDFWSVASTHKNPGLLWQPLPQAMAQHVVARWETHSGLVLEWYLASRQQNEN